MKILLFLLLWAIMGRYSITYGQSNGGGVWLEKNASCIGSVISFNQAVDGYGVGGGVGTNLVNSTIIGNLALIDTNSYPKPGDIYCADGKIVDRETYVKKEQKNAIGIVFWINGDPNVKYPKGAVVALEESEKKLTWGDYAQTDDDILWLNAIAFYDPVGHAYWVQKDTNCYQNTLWMVKRDQEKYLNFEAGPYCWEYKAYYQKNNPQKESKDIRWCMPTLMFLKRLVVTSPEIRKSLVVIRENGLNCVDFKRGDTDYYWSSDDGVVEALASHAWTVEFGKGRYSFGNENTWKYKGNWVRPIFLYGERE